MIFRHALIFLVVFVFYSDMVNSACLELSKKSSSAEDEFFISCDSSFNNVNYVVNQFIGEETAFGMISFNQGFHGFACANDEDVNSCVINPMGAVKIETEMQSSSRFLSLLATNDKKYFSQNLKFRFPRVTSSKNNNDCFVAVDRNNRYFLGVNTKNLSKNLQCFIQLEMHASKYP